MSTFVHFARATFKYFPMQIIQFPQANLFQLQVFWQENGHDIPLALRVEYSIHLDKILILKCEGIIKKVPMSATSMNQ